MVNLLPSNAPATKAFGQFLQEFGTADSLFIVLERKSGGEVAALTTLVGFGSLVLFGYPGPQFMGAAALMGIGFGALIPLTLLPLLIQKLLTKRSSF